MAKGKYEYWLTEDGLTLLEGWARSGLNEEQIADKIGISRSTLSRWKVSHRDIWDTLKKGKEVVDFQVENALLKRALGYSYTEETKERRFNKETGKYELIITKAVTKHVPPDVIAIIFWLKNRKPDDWREKIKDARADEQDDGVEVIFRGEETGDC